MTKAPTKITIKSVASRLKPDGYNDPDTLAVLFSQWLHAAFLDNKIDYETYTRLQNWVWERK